jgi:phosphate transport system substrate-binding protein
MIASPRLQSRIHLLLFGCLLTIGCGKTTENPSEENATTGKLEIVADEQLRPAMDSLVNGFMQENPKAKITVKYETSGEAMQDLLAQKSRLIIISRFLSAEARTLLDQNKLMLPEYDMAEDALAIVVNPQSHLGALAMSDLGRIVRGETKLWSELKFSKPLTGTTIEAGPIELAESPRSSSSEFLLDSLFLRSGEFQKGKIARFGTSDSIAWYVKSHPNAIGIVGAAWAHNYSSGADSSLHVSYIIPADSSSKGLTEPILLHLSNIFQGLYPLTLRVNGYTFENPNTLPRGFLAYAMTAHGQTVFKNFNILPRTQQIKLVPSK